MHKVVLKRERGELERQHKTVLTWVCHTPLETGDIFRTGHGVIQDAGAHHGGRLEPGIELPLDWNVDDAGEVNQAHLWYNREYQ